MRERQNMTPSQSVSKTMQLLLLYCFLASFHDLVHGDPPYNIPLMLLSLTSTIPLMEMILKLLFHFNPISIICSPFLTLNHVTSEKCNNCISAASKSIQNLCPNTTDAVVWEEDWELRYSKERFFGHLDVTLHSGNES